MRKTLLAFATSATILYIPLSGYQSGPAANGEGNRTTSGTNATCSSNGCHGVNNTHTIIALKLMEGTVPVTDGQYKPGTLYTVTLTGINTATLPLAYGFQLTAATLSKGQAGSFIAGGAVHTSNANTNGLTVVEHNTSIPATSGAATTPTFSWLAPPAGTGTVTFHATMNAVNGNNFSDTADHASTASFSIADKSLSVDDKLAKLAIAVYPNPVSSFMHVSIERLNRNVPVKIAVCNLAGKEVYSAISNESTIKINTSGWAKGPYNVLIADQYRRACSTVMIR